MTFFKFKVGRYVRVTPKDEVGEFGHETHVLDLFKTAKGGKYWRYLGSAVCYRYCKGVWFADTMEEIL